MMTSTFDYMADIINDTIEGVILTRIVKVIRIDENNVRVILEITKTNGDTKRAIMIRPDDGSFWPWLENE